MVNWNEDDNERRLLLVLLGNPELKGNWDEIAGILGPDFVGNGIRQKYHKLKREADALIAGGSAVASITTPTSTNKKPANTAKASSATTNKGRKRNAEAVINVDSDDEKDEKTPSKKAKPSPSKEAKPSPSKDKDAELFNDEAFGHIRNGDEED